MTYVYATGSITFNSEDSSTTQTAMTQSVVKSSFSNFNLIFPKTFQNTARNIFLSVNLASNTFAVGMLSDDGNFENAITTMNYDSDWTFDSTSLNP